MATEAEIRNLENTKYLVKRSQNPNPVEYGGPKPYMERYLDLKYAPE